MGPVNPNMFNPAIQQTATQPGGTDIQDILRKLSEILTAHDPNPIPAAQMQKQMFEPEADSGIGAPSGGGAQGGVNLGGLFGQALSQLAAQRAPKEGQGGGILSGLGGLLGGAGGGGGMLSGLMSMI